LLEALGSGTSSSGVNQAKPCVYITNGFGEISRGCAFKNEGISTAGICLNQKVIFEEGREEIDSS
jgi:hypothetical protein